MADRTCLYCGAPVTGNRVQCGAEPCRKAHNNATQKRNSAEHKTRTGLSYTQKARPAKGCDVACSRCGKPLRMAALDSPVCRECKRTPKPPKPPKPKRLSTGYRPDQRSPLRRAFEAGDIERFVELLRSLSVDNRNGCWIWQGRHDKWGYAIGNRGSVHRLTAQLRWPHLGSLPVHHTCANRMCVNPDHQVPASHAENIGEMLARQWYIGRISDLEEALAGLAPEHPLLGMIDDPLAPFVPDILAARSHARQPIKRAATSQPSLF